MRESVQLRKKQVEQDFKSFHRASIERWKERYLKVSLLKERFKKKEDQIRGDLEEACKICENLSKRFSWWQKQELP